MLPYVNFRQNSFTAHPSLHTPTNSSLALQYLTLCLLSGLGTYVIGKQVRHRMLTIELLRAVPGALGMPR